MERRISVNFCCKNFKIDFHDFFYTNLILFFSYNKRGTRIFKQDRKNSNPDMPIDKRRVRDIGYEAADGKFVSIPERVPELIVPDLTGCKLKPYVTYKTTEVVQSEFTSEDLFNAIYAKKIIDDFKNDKINEDGTSKDPSPEEQLNSEIAFQNARKTGTDIF